MAFEQKFLARFIIGFVAMFGLGGISAQALVLKNLEPYYGKQFYDDVAKGVRDQELKSEIRAILDAKHSQAGGSPFEVVAENCSPGANCYGHKSVGYKEARKLVLGTLPSGLIKGNPSVVDVYCDRLTTEESEQELNVEHTWPQSEFAQGKTDMQKSDLHHLYPTNSTMNNLRANLPFGMVTRATRSVPCQASRLGQSDSGRMVFEPPQEHKGNVARALFYFSVRYKMPIDAEQESVLRRWHQEDPVDLAEADRNDSIHELQGSRNPFVDFPQLVDVIQDF